MKRVYVLSLYAVTLTALATAGIQSSLEERRATLQNNARAQTFLDEVEFQIKTPLHKKQTRRVRSLLLNFNNRSDGYTVGICIDQKAGLPTVLTSTASQHIERDWLRHCQNKAENTDKTGYKIHQRAINWDETLNPIPARIILIEETTSVRASWWETFIRTITLSWFGGIIILLLITSQTRHWLKSHANTIHGAIRSLIAGRTPTPSFSTSETPEFAKLQQDMERLATKVFTLPGRSKSNTDTNALGTLRDTIGNRQITIIANREPYIHQRQGDEIHVVRPASGLVTALEPILRQCGGLWIAHGSGNADRETCDENNSVRVPPANPKYTLRRVWLSQEEELGYYYGFSNEGLWPLCHLAHTRPIFRLSDWQHYSQVNERFCASVPDTSLNGHSMILVQDYHFALLPRLLRERAESQRGEPPRIGIFWHIPWPNPEAFGICPWHRDLLRGMLGADLIGFHTQYHCNNFLETCDRYLETRIDREHFSVTMENHETLVRAFPIGIETQAVKTITNVQKRELKEKLGIAADIVAIGVDRIDYTKGLVERVESVERFLEKNPEFIGRFSLVQVGSPSRTHIPSYQLLNSQLQTAVDRVNAKFSANEANGYKPVIFLPHHHDWEHLQALYQLGDLCLVTSLHDGMNLVAKEYVWCQQGGDGALILSKFTGASRELTDALIVNPYSIEEMADAISMALALPSEERVRRLKAMQRQIAGHTAFHWASDIVFELISEVRRFSFPASPSSARRRAI